MLHERWLRSRTRTSEQSFISVYRVDSVSVNIVALGGYVKYNILYKGNFMTDYTHTKVCKRTIFHRHYKKTNYQALTCCMNVGYVAGHERVSSLLFQCIVSIL
jgi:hypothetical protein